MATKNFNAKTLILVFENGTDESGNPVYVRKSIPTVSELAAEDKIYEVGSKIAQLYSYPLVKIMMDEDFVLSV